MIHPRPPSLRSLLTLACVSVLAVPAAALDLAWPDGAHLADRSAPDLGSLRIATGPYAEGGPPTTREDGALLHEVWQIPGEAGEPLALLNLLRTQLADQGYDIGFTCADTACGGFDFRYALPIDDGPEMHVDLGNYHYLTATREDANGRTLVAVTVSHGGRQGYAHVAAVLPPDGLAPVVTPSTRAPEQAALQPDLIDGLLQSGRAVLDDLTFETGASALSGARYDSLVSLAEYLSANPDRTVVLVGHTDAEGSLDANITLSRARANAVRQFLIDSLNVAPDQIASEGIGFLAPRASNSTDEGRQANRRVEVVLADPG